MSDIRIELYVALKNKDPNFLEEWIEDKKNDLDKGVNISPLRRTLEMYIENPKKFLKEAPFSKLKDVPQSKIKEFLNELVRIFGTTRGGGEYEKTKRIGAVEELAKPIISNDDLENLEELLEVIRELPPELKKNEKIKKILESIKEKTSGIRLFFAKKQPTKEFFDWLAKELGGIVEKEDFILSKDKETGKNEIETDKMSIVFPEYNRVNQLIDEIRKFYEKIVSGELIFLENQGFSDLNEMRREGKPTPLTSGSKIRLGGPPKTPKYKVKPFDALVLREYLKKLQDIPTSKGIDKETGGKIRDSVNLKQFLPPTLPDGKRQFPKDLVFASTSGNLFRVNPLFKIIMTQVLGKDWFNAIKDQSQTQQAISRKQIEEMIVDDLTLSYMNKESNSRQFKLKVPIFTKKGSNVRLESSSEKIKEKMKEEIKDNANFSDAITNAAKSIQQGMSNTVGEPDRRQYQDAVNDLGIEEIFTFEPRNVRGISRFAVKRGKKIIEIGEFYEDFLEQLEPTEATDDFKEGLLNIIKVQEWLATMTDFVESSIASLLKGHRLYQEGVVIPQMENLSSLKIEHLLEIILLIDESFTREDDKTTILYQEIDKFADKEDWDKVEELLEEVESNTAELFSDVAIELQKSFEKQLQNMIENAEAGQKYDYRYKAPNASISKIMLRKLKEAGFIEEI